MANAERVYHNMVHDLRDDDMLYIACAPIFKTIFAPSGSQRLLVCVVKGDLLLGQRWCILRQHLGLA